VCGQFATIRVLVSRTLGVAPVTRFFDVYDDDDDDMMMMMMMMMIVAAFELEVASD